MVVLQPEGLKTGVLVGIAYPPPERLRISFANRRPRLGPHQRDSAEAAMKTVPCQERGDVVLAGMRAAIRCSLGTKGSRFSTGSGRLQGPPLPQSDSVHSVMAGMSACRMSLSAATRSPAR